MIISLYLFLDLLPRYIKPSDLSNLSFSLIYFCFLFEKKLLLILFFDVFKEPTLHSVFKDPWMLITFVVLFIYLVYFKCVFGVVFISLDLQVMAMSSSNLHDLNTKSSAYHQCSKF